MYSVPSTDLFKNGAIYNSAIFSLMSDDQNLWVGTMAGLNKYNTQTGEISHFIHDPDDPLSISNGPIKAIYKISKGEYWIGSDIGGVCVFDGKNDVFKKYEFDQGDPGSISSNQINAIMEDSKKRIWISTNMGLNKFNPETTCDEKL